MVEEKGRVMNSENEKRQLEDWLSAYTDYTSEQESPSLFHFWCGTSVIASTLGRNVYINRGYYTLYPNLYVVFVGASAQVKKTTAIHIGYDIFKRAFKDANMVSQRGTPESMISIFVDRFKQKGVSDGVIVSDELEVFLGGQNRAIDLVQLLTKWYDCPDSFDYHTMMRGKEEMNNVCCNMIAGTTPSGLREGLPHHSIGGGFTSRVIFVYQDKPEKRVAFPEITNEQEAIKVKLISDLKEIEKVRGQFTLTKNAKEWYEDWYMDVFRPENTTHIAMDGYYGRKPDTLLKVAMCLSVSRGSSMVVDELELRMALKALGKNEQSIPSILKLVQMTDVGEETEKVLRNISKRERIDYTTLTRNLSYCMNSKRVEEVVGDLLSMDKIVHWVEGGKRWYKIK